MNFLKKVIAVKRVAVSDITSFDRLSNNKVMLASSQSFENLNIKVPGDLEITSKTENKVRMFTAKLMFSFCGEHFQTGQFLYVVSLADGSRMVLGSDDKPYPVEETSDKYSSDMGSSQLTKVTVTYKSHLTIASLT